MNFMPDKEYRKINKTKCYFLIIFSLAFLTYAQTIFFNYVYLDDDGIILENFDRISSWDKIGDAFTQSYIEGNYYRPIIILSFIVDAQIGGQNALFFHLSNVLLHSILSCLVFLLLIKLRIKWVWAIMLACFFAVSPLMSNAVSWIAGRNDIIVAFFSILSILFLIEFLEENKWYIFVFHIVSMFLAFLSKETAIALPIICFLYLFLFHREKNISKSIFYLIWIILPVIYVMIRSGMTKNHVPTGIIPFFNNTFIILEELSKSFFPFGLKVFPDYNFILTLSGIFIFLFLIIYLFNTKTINKKNYIFGLLWFFLFLSPSLLIRHVAPDAGFNYLDCRIYLPFIGVLIILSEILNSARKENLKKIIVITSGAILLLLIVNQIESEVYRTGENFWKSAIKDYPNRAFYYRGLAHYYSEQNNFVEAALYEEKAISINPSIQKYYHEASVYYNQLGLYPKAIEKLNQVISLEKNQYNSYITLMYLWGKTNRKDSLDLCIYKFINGIINKSKVDSVLLSISSTLNSEGNRPMAKYFVQKAYEFNPNNDIVLNYLAIYEYLDGNIPASQKYMIEAIKIDPENQDYKNNLRKILQKG